MGHPVNHFQNYKPKMGSPPTAQLKYTQIVHHLKPILSKQRAIPSQLLTLLSTPPHQPTQGSKVFYNLITLNDAFCKTPNIIKWEMELGKQFPPSQWHAAIQWAHRSSSCANHRGQFHKLLTRWYFTPLRLAKLHPTALLRTVGGHAAQWVSFFISFVPACTYNQSWIIS